MQVKYDEVADALYVYFTHEPVARTEVLSGEANVDYDAANNMVGVEILDPSEGVNLRNLPRQAEIARLLERLRFPIYA